MPLFVPPIFQKKCLGIFLTLTITESSLGFGPCDKMVSRQIDFQIFPYGATNLSLWTPSTTVLFLPYSTNIRTSLQWLYIVIIHIFMLIPVPRILRTDGFHFVTGGRADCFIRDFSFFHAEWKNTFF